MQRNKNHKYHLNPLLTDLDFRVIKTIFGIGSHLILSEIILNPLVIDHLARADLCGLPWQSELPLPLKSQLDRPWQAQFDACHEAYSKLGTERLASIESHMCHLAGHFGLTHNNVLQRLAFFKNCRPMPVSQLYHVSFPHRSL